jgi:hypothetical protein
MNVPTTKCVRSVDGVCRSLPTRGSGRAKEPRFSRRGGGVCVLGSASGGRRVFENQIRKLFAELSACCLSCAVLIRKRFLLLAVAGGLRGLPFSAITRTRLRLCPRSADLWRAPLVSRPVYGASLEVLPHPVSGVPLVLPVVPSRPAHVV